MIGYYRHCRNMRDPSKRLQGLWTVGFARQQTLNRLASRIAIVHGDVETGEIQVKRFLRGNHFDPIAKRCDGIVPLPGSRIEGCQVVDRGRIVAARFDGLLKKPAGFAVPLPLDQEFAHLVRCGVIFRIDFEGAAEHLLRVRQGAEGHLRLARVHERRSHLGAECQSLFEMRQGLGDFSLADVHRAMAPEASARAFSDPPPAPGGDKGQAGKAEQVA